MVPQRSYIVAATPRTGSNLLCEGLEATGIAGRPAEIFAPHLRAVWERYLEVGPADPFRAYLDAAVRFGTTKNGVHGFKIHWLHVVPLALDAACDDDVLARLFPDAVFVNIVRRDRRAQALSWYRAELTKEWFRYTDDGDQRSPGAIPFDTAAVAAYEASIEEQQSAWTRYFAARGIEVLTVEYEDLAREYHAQLSRVLAFLRLDAAAADALPPPRLVRQADDVTARWRTLLDTVSS